MYWPERGIQNANDAGVCRSPDMDFVRDAANRCGRATNGTAHIMVRDIAAPSQMGACGGYSTHKGFSIMRVLLVILLIVLVCLFMLLTMPQLRRLARVVKQIAQFASIATGLELFNSEFDGYPPSDALDSTGKPYCGAMKLCEALMGRDLLGFHPDSLFRANGMDSDAGRNLYPVRTDLHNLGARKRPYLPLENANAYRLGDLYDNTRSFDPNSFVLCDVFGRIKHKGTGKRIGMPVLYYKANTSKTVHDVNDPNNPENIYDYKDNHALVGLGVPGEPGQKHPLFENPKIFYEMTRDYKFAKTSKPQRADTFILISAGRDGLYGTKDDIANFDMQWKPK